MIPEVISKITSEALLSLYPTIVKNIDIPFDMKLLSRFVSYSLISILFVDISSLKRTCLVKPDYYYLLSQLFIFILRIRDLKDWKVV